MASDAETALAAELKASRERAEQLAALLDAERKVPLATILLLCLYYDRVTSPSSLGSDCFSCCASTLKSFMSLIPS